MKIDTTKTEGTNVEATEETVETTVEETTEVTEEVVEETTEETVEESTEEVTEESTETAEAAAEETTEEAGETEETTEETSTEEPTGEGNEEESNDSEGSDEPSGEEETGKEEGQTQKPKKETQAEIAAKTESAKLKLIVVGKKGITNKQMIDAMNTHFADAEKLQMLYNDFTEVFELAAHYTKDIVKAHLEEFIRTQEGKADFQVKPMGKKIREMLDKGVKAADIESTIAAEKEKAAAEREQKRKEREHKKLKFAEKFEHEDNEKLADIVRGNVNWKDVLDEKHVEMVIMAIQDKSYTEIAEELEMNKDTVKGQLFKNKSSVLNTLSEKATA